MSADMSPVSKVIALKNEWKGYLDQKDILDPATVRSLLADLLLIVQGTQAYQLVRSQFDQTAAANRSVFDRAALEDLFSEVINLLF